LFINRKFCSPITVVADFMAVIFDYINCTMSILWIKCGYFIYFVLTGFKVIETMHCMGLVPHRRAIAHLDPLELEINYNYNYNMIG
jgi:hypothetical protein